MFVRDEKRYAVLFQSVVLPCQYNSVSTQTPVVQWVYKSYCRDRTRDSFGHADAAGGGLGGSGLNGGTRGAGVGYETGMTASYLDCSDSSRTVRMVAAISGSSVTLSEYYKNRDISIINSKNSLAHLTRTSDHLKAAALKLRSKALALPHWYKLKHILHYHHVRLRPFPECSVTFRPFKDQLKDSVCE